MGDLSSMHMASPTPPLCSATTGLFTDEEFLSAAQQVQNPRLEGWELFVECMGVKIYRKYREDTGLYEYKTYGLLEELDPEISAMVYLDWQYRKKWDTYTLDIHPIKDEDKNMEGLYWGVDYPWPMYDRDREEEVKNFHFKWERVLFRSFCDGFQEGRMMEVGGERTWVVMSRSQPFPCCPEKSGIIRVDTFWESYAIQSDGRVGSKVFMHHYDNPKGMIPIWLINWVAKTGLPHFLKITKKAVLGYKDYLKQENKEHLLEEVQQFWTQYQDIKN